MDPEDEVLVDEAGADGAIARSRADAPEIDGSVRVAKTKTVRPGDMLRVRITGSDDYDLEGEAL